MKISVIVVTRNEGAELRRTVENLRDSSDADLDFRIALQDGTPLQWADSYLENGDADCRCVAPATAEEATHVRASDVQRLMGGQA